MLTHIKTIREALENLQGLCSEDNGFIEAITVWTPEAMDALDALESRLSAAPAAQPTLKDIAKRMGVHIPDTYVPSEFDEAVLACDGVLMEEQRRLLRQCRTALDELLSKKPMLAGMLCGSTTLGNLRASLYEQRPQGVIGSAAPAAQPMTEQEITYGFEAWQSSPAPEGWHFESDKTRARVAFMDGIRYAERHHGIKEQP